MKLWLLKSEPSDWSWADQVARGAKGEDWTGVRNHQARRMLREMAVDDLAFFYHSQTERAIVGIVRVIAPAHPDPTDDTGRWDCVTVSAEAPLPRPVTLAACKADGRLAGMALVRLPRLSVQPVEPEEWTVVLDLAGV
ncbi:hypothetical protein OCGS_1537 [Oceaniovalibus guishaninsula JLT2003]|uniref:EVE domain-containing protein n=1 Tax=Oceaniovalibus guishaninsula JLT2003 TaxID=1231392 RepID=K2HPA6_9RHOB|nr:EVE domain-containing protein [Oceaniovalibus guishaninsula]EKE44699.1 hypothetical protein OCGS_1537 [Oceaniovalibus guishaninsula JLT2003]